MTITIPQVPSNTSERFELAHTKLGRKIALKAETVLLAYPLNCSPDKFKAYYKETIVPWLNDKYSEWQGAEQKKQGYDPNAQYPMAIYLLDKILLVFTTTEIFQPWESIARLRDYVVTQPDEEKLEWSPPKAAENTKAAETPAKTTEKPDYKKSA